MAAGALRDWRVHAVALQGTAAVCAQPGAL